MSTKSPVAAWISNSITVSVITTVLSVILFLAFQRFFVQGLATTGLR